jgi:lipopolysaccharide/colanic/teichoic acid biosynthesis glycosyltransferase
VADPPPTKLVLDFSQTVFMDSSAVGALVNNVRTAQQKGIDLVLRNVQPQVMAVLSITGLDQVLTVERSGPPPLATDRKNRVENQLPTTHPSVRSWVKRVLDVIGAIVGLGITAILLIPIGIAIKLDSPGPIFFSQIRCGWMGRRFRLWKLRSMCTNAEALKSQVENKVEGPLFKNDNDPRITKVGRFLRRTSLDELPQFLNVLKGDMSLVGTRPPTPDEVERYEVPEWQRLDVKPGMTGEWQVNGRSKITKFEDVIKMDLQYQKNWSLIYDLKLIVKTILVLFRKNSGAM